MFKLHGFLELEPHGEVRESVYSWNSFIEAKNCGWLFRRNILLHYFYIEKMGTVLYESIPDNFWDEVLPQT
jgi:hypothetical protein